MLRPSGSPKPFRIASTHFGFMRLLAAGLLVFFSGCVSTQPASLDTPEGRALVNERAVRGRTVLNLVGQRGQAVHALHVGRDFTTWVDMRSREGQSAATDSVVSVTFQRRGRGALQGMAVGTAAGLALSVVAPPSQRSCGGELFCLQPDPEAVVALRGVMGAINGAIVGSLVSNRRVYVATRRDDVAESARTPCAGLPLRCASQIARGAP